MKYKVLMRYKVYEVYGGNYMWRFCGTASFLELVSPYLASAYYLWLA